MKTIAIVCSDLHLSLKQPACRADEDWMATQAGYLEQLRTLADGRPVLCAGDIFDHWNVPPELINFALEHLPNCMVCVPGQHDLPNHRMDEMERSGYGVLKRAGKIVDLSSYKWPFYKPRDGDFIVFGFGWGVNLAPVKPMRGNGLHIALIHRYVWTIGKCYPGAPQENHLSEVMESLAGFNTAVFGDNHKGFARTLKTGTHVLNCGAFIRRKSDERNYRPQVGRLLEDGSIETVYLDTSNDRFHEQLADREEIAFNMKEFVEELQELGEHGLNFREAVEQALRDEDIHPAVKALIIEALEADNKSK